MLEFIEKTLLTTMGAFSLSQKKTEELLADLKKRFNVTEEEGKAFLNSLQERARENQKKLEELALQEVQQACSRVGVVTLDEFDKLKKKVATLEKMLKEKGA